MSSVALKKNILPSLLCSTSYLYRSNQKKLPSWHTFVSMDRYMHIITTIPSRFLYSRMSGCLVPGFSREKRRGILRAQLPNLYASSVVFYSFPSAFSYLVLEKWKTRYYYYYYYIQYCRSLLAITVLLGYYLLISRSIELSGGTAAFV